MRRRVRELNYLTSELRRHQGCDLTFTLTWFTLTFEDTYHMISTQAHHSQFFSVRYIPSHFRASLWLEGGGNLIRCKLGVSLAGGEPEADPFEGGVSFLRGLQRGCVQGSAGKQGSSLNK